MTTGDGIPSYDPVGSATRHTLYKIGLGDGVPHPRPWNVVVTAARRLRRKRVATGVAATAIVLTGAGAANAVAASHGPGEIPGLSPIPLPPGITTTSGAPATALPENMPARMPDLPARRPSPPPRNPTATTATTTTTVAPSTTTTEVPTTTTTTVVAPDTSSTSTPVEG